MRGDHWGETPERELKPRISRRIKYWQDRGLSRYVWRKRRVINANKNGTQGTRLIPQTCGRKVSEISKPGLDKMALLIDSEPS